MRYVLGIEGGQTTTAVIAEETGCLLGIGHSHALSGRTEGGDAQRGLRRVREAVQSAVRMADLENARFAAACISLFDAPHEAQNPSLPELQAACDSVLPVAQCCLEPRVRVALYAVTFGQPGIVVRAGTGSIAYGRNEAGEQAQCGGWGTFLGNEGSGGWIARRALNACCRAHDGVESPTLLTALLLKHLEMTDLPQLQRAMAAKTLGEEDVAILAEIVSRAAAQNDATARRILREAGKELAWSAQAVLRRLNLGQEPVTIGTAGGVFRAGRAVLRTFRERVKQAAPHATIVSARMPLAVGAALIALETLDVPLRREVVTNLESNLPRLTAAKA